MPKIVSLKDNNSIIKYPATISDAVIDLGTGKKLSDIIDSLFDYLYFEAVQDSNISFTKASGLTIDLKYKIDNGKWQNYSSQITLAAGHKAYFKGDNEKISESGKLSKFIITGGVNVGGNIMSLLGFRSQPGKNSFSCLFDYCIGILSTENLKLPATTLAQNCYEGMFRGCSSLTTPPQLPATTLASYCYYYMFMGCTSLTTPPQLPATTLVSGCYYQMFINCTSLIRAPELPATTLAQDCYGSMFQGCTSLVEIPSILPATTLVQSCYQSMFSGCTSLTTTPSLPATTLALFCYDSMFYGCTSLVEVPSILPATTLAQGCYGLMFYGCTSLEKAPELPAPTLVGDCYGMMFYECSKLNYIKALFTTSPTTQTYDWVNGVAPSGTFIKSSEATWNVNGNNGVPANWVIYKSLPTSNQSKIYTNVLRKDASYSSPYSKSYFYFGQLKQIDLLRPSYIKYRVIAYTSGNGNFMLDSIVKWDFGYNGIYKSYCIYNNLSSTSYYPFGYHTLYRSNSAAITQSDGSYFGFYFGSSNSYGQSASTIARTIEVEILECYNCEATLIDSPICLTDAADVPANFRQTSTSVAYNTTNFTAVNVSTAAGLQETGDANSDTVGYSIRTNSYSKPMKSALGYGYRLLFTSGDQLGWVPANNSSSSNATAVRTPATDPIDPFGEIVYYSGTAAVAANSRPSATTLWEQYAVTLGYSFNTTGAALTLTSWKPVYVKCTPQVNGSAVIEGYTQDLPTGEDGFIYIYLGVAYSATAIELVIKHPVYSFKDGGIKPWTATEDIHNYEFDYLTFKAVSEGTFTYSNAAGGQQNSNNKISYSLDNGKTWSTESDSVSLSVSQGDKVLWKGNQSTTFGGICTFGGTANFEVSGNLLSVLFGDDFLADNTIDNYRACGFMFYGSNCVSASNLILPVNPCASMFNSMFYNCTGLINTPDLTKIILANSCYNSMFQGCTSLTTPPELPATTLANYCYNNMFYGCTSLTTTPELPATSLASGCYRAMFYGCTSLTTPPQLPATTLASYCYYQMFQGCTSLTKAPELPATTLASTCYCSMFNGCTSLIEAPELPSVDSIYEDSYSDMFNGCSSLNYIKAMLTATPSSHLTANWVSGVAATGVFIKNDLATWNVSGVNGVPTGWNVYTESEYKEVRHYELATTSANGLMSSSDKTKLDGIAAGAQVNVVTSVDTTATAGVNLSLTSGKLDVTVSGGSIASGNGNVVTGGTVYAVTSTLAPKASPALTGTPTAPTAAAGTNTTQIATTAFVKNAVDSKTHYIANLQSGTAANYITEPEFKSVKVNGSSTNSASSSNCVLQYDTTNKCLKFIFN